MNQQEFLQKLQLLTQKASQNGGRLLRSEVDETLGEGLTQEQLGLVYQYLQRSRITVEGWEQSLQDRLNARSIFGDAADTDTKEQQDTPDDTFDDGETPSEEESDTAGKDSAQTEADTLAEEEEELLGALGVYLEELEQLEEADMEMRSALLLGAKEGDAKALSALAESYLSTVADMVSEYEKDAPLPVEDLLQEGNIALWEALSDLTEIDSVAGLGAMVMNKVSAQLERVLQEELDEGDAGQSMASQVNRLSSTLRELEEDLGHPASIEEVSAFLEMDTDHIKDIISLAGDQIGKAE